MQTNEPPRNDEAALGRRYCRPALRPALKVLGQDLCDFQLLTYFISKKKAPAGATHRHVLSTSINASCGMLTEPKDFIRFFPSFCFSSNLRLRVMSPP